MTRQAMSPDLRQMWLLWRQGWNTARIAKNVGRPECEVDRLLVHHREMMRATRPANGKDLP